MRVLDATLAHYYALALVAVARADEQIGLEEGQRLQERLEERAGRPVPLDDLLLAESIEPAHLAELLRSSTGPFRGGTVHPGELAAMIVVDAIAVVLAKGYVSEAEAREVIRFATALGCSIEEVRAMSQHLTPWLTGPI